MHSLQSSQWATNRQRLIRLKGSIQTYDWGKKGSSSLVARLAKNAIGQEFIIDENKSYAEVIHAQLPFSRNF